MHLSLVEVRGSEYRWYECSRNPWTFPSQPKNALLGFWIFRNPEASGRLDLMKSKLPEVRNSQNPSHESLDLMQSKFAELGFDEIQTPEAWIPSNPSFRSLDFMNFGLPEAWVP